MKPRTLLLFKVFSFFVILLGIQLAFATTEVLSPQKIKATPQTSVLSKNFSHAINNVDGVVTLINGNGRDLSRVQCPKRPLKDYISCEAQNLIKKIVLLVDRPTSVELRVNNQVLIASQAYNPELGQYQIPIKVYQANQLVIKVKGVWTASVTVNVKAESVPIENQNPIAKILANPKVGVLPVVISFSALESFDPDHDALVEYKWDFGDGTFATGSLVTHQYVDAGDYIVKLTVTDIKGGTGVATENISLKVNQVPLAVLSLKSPATGTAPLMAWFDASLSADPEGRDLKLTWDFGDGSRIENSDQNILTHEFKEPGIYLVKLTVIDSGGLEASKTLSVEALALQLPVNPETIAPALSVNELTDFSNQIDFLYSGANPIQTEAIPEAFDSERVSVVRGKILNSSGQPLLGVEISATGAPQFGKTLTRADGQFDFAVNYKKELLLQFRKGGFAFAQRHVSMSGQDFYQIPEVRLVEIDSKVSIVKLNSDNAQIVQGSLMQDASGARTATVIIPSQTQAKIRLADGALQDVGSLSIRATEFTVGEEGPRKMPAELPARSAYTYAVDLTADEASAVNAKGIEFSKPVSFYVDNFLSVPVGMAVPLGYLNPDKGAWEPLHDGVVVQIVDIQNGQAIIDTTGLGPASADDLAYFGFDSSELKKLAETYQVGKTLWRVQVRHFSVIDLNFGWGMDNDFANIQGPNQDKPPKTSPENCDTECGSIIDTQRQVLKEKIDLPGTGHSLYYSTEKSGARAASNTIQIPLLESSLLSELVNIEVTVDIAGQTITKTFLPELDAVFNYTWNGLDAYGRAVLGNQNAKVLVRYNYNNAYWWLPFDRSQPATFDTYNRGITVTNIPTRGLIAIDRSFNLQLKPPFDIATKRAMDEVGRWTFTAHHFFDPEAQTIYWGDGSSRSASDLPKVVTTIAGTGAAGFSGDGGPATNAKLNSLWTVTYDENTGSYYIPDAWNFRVRKIDKNGIITTIAGTGSSGISGDGGPASQAEFKFPVHVAIGFDGSIYIADSEANNIRKITPDGIIHTVAGTGVRSFSGDGGPAINATFNNPTAVTVSKDGSLFISDVDNHRIRRITPDGIITTFAGTGEQGFSGDGEPAIMAQFNQPRFTSLDKNGNLYVADAGNYRVRKILPTGRIITVAGDGNQDFSGDNGPAKKARMRYVMSAKATDNGELYIADKDNNRIRYVDSLGTISTILGNEKNDFNGDYHPGVLTNLKELSDVIIKSNGSLAFVDRQHQRIREFGSLAFKPDANGNYVIPSESGHEVYIFNAKGLHLKTLFGKTGKEKYIFHYVDTNILDSIEDGNGNLTRILRSSNGSPVAIQSPYGPTFPLVLDSNGSLESLSLPTGETYKMTYTSRGLLSEFKRPKGNTSTYEFDGLGYLIKATNGMGGVQTLSHTRVGTAYHQTQEGRRTSARYLEDSHGVGGYVLLEGGGDRRTETYTNESSEWQSRPDESNNYVIFDTDSRFNGMAKFKHIFSNRTPSGFYQSSYQVQTYERLNGLFDFSYNVQEWNDDISFRQMSYSSATQILSSSTGLGKISQVKIDSNERPVISQMGSDEPVHYSYDSRGRLVQMTQGIRQTILNYDINGFLQQTTDPENRVAKYNYNSSGRLMSQVNADNKMTAFSYDPNGNLLSITNAMGNIHTIISNLIDMISLYQAPDVGSPRESQYEYNFDQQLVKETRAQGEILNYNYEAIGKFQDRCRVLVS